MSYPALAPEIQSGVATYVLSRDGPRDYYTLDGSSDKAHVWMACRDATREGRVYYWNKASSERTWVLPPVVENKPERMTVERPLTPAPVVVATPARHHEVVVAPLVEPSPVVAVVAAPTTQASTSFRDRLADIRSRKERLETERIVAPVAATAPAAVVVVAPPPVAVVAAPSPVVPAVVTPVTPAVPRPAPARHVQLVETPVSTPRSGAGGSASSSAVITRHPVRQPNTMPTNDPMPLNLADYVCDAVGHGHGLSLGLSCVLHGGVLTDGGVLHGKGDVHAPGGNIVVAEFKDSKVSTVGSITYASGDVLMWKWCDMAHPGTGEVSIKYKNGDLYDGGVAQFKKHGAGVFRYALGHVYRGQFQWGMMHGHGTFEFQNGSVYTGELTNNKFEGHGRYQVGQPMQSSYDGQWKDGTMHGEGSMTYANGDVWTGRWKNDKRWQGKYTFSKQFLIR